MGNLQCVRCGEVIESALPKYKCPRCGGLLEYRVDYEKIDHPLFSGEFNFWRYRKLFPEVRNVATISEGGTPLHEAKRLAEEMDMKRIYLKDETRNPTNSFRDRSAALLVSNALDLGFEAILCATNGNLGASLAAYCARYGIICHIIIPRIVDMGKLAQMLIYDAIIEEHGETVDKAIERAEKMSEETGWYQATPELNPFVIEAQKTISFEVYEQLGPPDWFIVPMGSGGTIYSIWKGFQELYRLGIIKKTPKMIGIQAEGCSPIIRAYYGAKGNKQDRSTHAIGILVKKPIQWELAIKAIRESKGIAVSVSDNEIFTAEQSIAKLEGIFAEPASSGTIAALKKVREEKIIDRDETVVCLITGSGLKATDILQALSKKRKTAILGVDFSTKEKILRLLNRGDTYGYELWKRIGKIMTRPAIYQHLNDLTRRGLISSYQKDDRKYFTITERGRRVLQAIDEIKVML